jgi:hypothetical protein
MTTIMLRAYFRNEPLHYNCNMQRFVRFPKALRRQHPLGTRFLVYAKLTDKEGGNDFVHTNHAWDVQVLGPPPAGDDMKYKK